jgi:hypothetical protein
LMPVFDQEREPAPGTVAKLNEDLKNATAG